MQGADRMDRIIIAAGVFQERSGWTVCRVSPGITGAMQSPRTDSLFMERIGMNTLKSKLLSLLPYIPLEKVK